MKANNYMEMLVELEQTTKEIVYHYGQEANLLQVVGTLEILKIKENRPQIIPQKPECEAEAMKYNLGALLNNSLVSEVEKVGILTMMQLDITQGAFQPEHNLDRVENHGVSAQ